MTGHNRIGTADPLEDARANLAQQHQVWIEMRGRHAQVRARGDELAAQLRAMTPEDHARPEAAETIFRALEASIAEAQRTIRAEQEAHQAVLYAQRDFQTAELEWLLSSLCSFQARRRGARSFSEAPRG